MSEHEDSTEGPPEKANMTAPAITTPAEKERRQLIEQLYEDSVSRYGIDSEQALLLLQLLKVYREPEN